MKKLIEINPDHANALNFVGYSYAEEGVNLGEAERMIKKALVLSPNKGYILDSLGWVYFKKGMYSEALDVLKEAAALQSNDPAILEHIGDVYEKMGNMPSALDYYRKALRMVSEESLGTQEEVELKARLVRKIDQISRNLNVES